MMAQHNELPTSFKASDKHGMSTKVGRMNNIRTRSSKIASQALIVIINGREKKWTSAIYKNVL